MILNLEENKITRIYYAHPKWLYNKPEEEQGLNTIRNFFGKNIEIINPKEYDENPIYRELKKRERMNFCHKLIDKSDCVVFQKFTFSKDFRKCLVKCITHINEYTINLNKEIRIHMEWLRNIIRKRKVTTPGITDEVNYALKNNKKLYEITKRGLKEVKYELKEDISLKNNQYSILHNLLQLYNNKKLTTLSLLNVLYIYTFI